MNKKIVAIWVSLAMVFGLIVIVDIPTDFVPTVKGNTLYVNETGSGGAYTKIQDAINVSSDGDTVYVYNGTYYENVVVNKTINLTGENRDTTIIDGGGMEDVIRIVIERVNVSRFTIRNSGDVGWPDFNAGIKIYSDLNTISDNKFTDNLYGIYQDHANKNNIFSNDVPQNNSFGIYLFYSNENHIFNNNVSYSDYGIRILSSNQNIINNNTILSNNWYGISLDSSKWNNITDNKMMEDGIDIWGNPDHWDTNSINMSNTVNGKPVYFWKNRTGGIIPLGAGQVILFNCTNITVENQELVNVTMGISIVNSMRINVTHNKLTNNKYGIRLEQSIENVIMNNNITSSSQQGIGIFSSNDNKLINNIAILSRYGMFLSNSNRNYVNKNNASDNWVGIAVVGSGENTIIHNNIFNNTARGIYLTSTGNNITYNLVVRNYDGFYLGPSSSKNNIIGNNITSNTHYGVHISSSSQNNIYHNNIIDNIQPAYDSTNMGNQWDNGYPLGGNFWSIYSGVDNYKGPYQDIPGSDGIGDTNYSIDSDSVDHYPLMEPYIYKPLENYTILKPGWNLISIPLIQNNQNLKKVLEMIDGYYDAVQWYDITDTNDPWKHNKVGKPFGNDLSEINETKGFWIHITPPGDTIFLYNGTQPTSNQTIPLYPGWNLVGYPSLTNYNRTEGLNNLTFDTHVNSIWTFNATTQKWKELGPTDYFELGRGYWIHAKVECEWEVPL